MGSSRGKDVVTFGLIGAVFAWGGALVWRLHGWSQRPPGGLPLGDLAQTLAAFFGTLLAQLAFRQVFLGFARAMIPKKPRWSMKVWGAKVVRCCDSFFRLFYFIAMTTYGWSILRSAPWLPWVLGGRGETRFCWTDGFPSQPLSADLQRYYLISAGYHLTEVAVLLLDERHPDFWEMALHHSVSVLLIFFSYALSYVRVGSLVLFLHGATDIFIWLSKAVVDTTYTRFMILCYFALVFLYAWLRLYAFPMFVMRSAWIESIAEAGPERLFGWGFLNFALFVLLLLHVYWFGLILKIGFIMRTTGQARDLQSNISGMDLDQKRR